MAQNIHVSLYTGLIKGNIPNKLDSVPKKAISVGLTPGR